MLFAVSGEHIANTDHCITTGVKPFSSAVIINSIINHSLVFIFVSFYLLVMIELLVMQNVAMNHAELYS